MRRLGVLAFTVVAACGSPPKGDDQTSIEIVADAASRDLVTELVRFIDGANITVVEAPGDADLRIDVRASLTDCSECYQLGLDGAGGITVVGSAPLGVQYGVAAALEELGFRFFHPWRAVVPDAPAVPASVNPAAQQPEMVTRGLHLHTIHPIEAYYAMWEPGDQNLDDAKRIVNWLVLNRGNYIQWVGLDDISNDPATAAAWEPHAEALVEYAHGRGLRTGLAIQLFGASNLQQGFDLVDSEEGATREEIESRYQIILGIDWDNINLSFGEFFGEAPESFIDAVNLAFQIQGEMAPGVEMATTIHVGDSPDQRVDFMDQNLIYYFLVKFADPGIIPWIHTVMFYNLYEDAGGAYHHDDFGEHRAYLMERLEAGARVGYFPETAYWIAFDVSVPAYLPVYIRSRWLDLHETRLAAQDAGIDDLEEQVLFSSGWEWGYWQNDYAALRASWQLPDTWETLVTDMLGDELAAPVIDLVELQHEHLIEGRLASYIAGRDLYMDLGYDIDVVSQPERPTLQDVIDMEPADRTAFAAEVLGGLEALAAGTEAVLARIDAIDRDDAFYRELRDGVEITALRARYIHAVFAAAVAFADGDDPAALAASADALFDQSLAIVERRHGALHYPVPDNLLFGTTNATYYQWGYLKQTNELCYWDRERIKLRRATAGSDDTVPPCVF